MVSKTESRRKRLLSQKTKKTMMLLAEVQNSGPLTEIIVGVVTTLILAAFRAIERGRLVRRHKRELKKAELQTPPVDAPEQLAKIEAEEKLLKDSISTGITPFVKSILKTK